MTLFLLLIVLVFLLLAAIWWTPKRPPKGAESQPSIFTALVAPSGAVASDRDFVLESEIDEIVKVIRQDEADRRRAAALDRLASLQASSKKTK
jgi:hypothetical protein